MRHRKPHKTCIVTLGCSKNIVDSELLLRQIRANNIALTDDPSAAEVLIINTCGFIEAAKQESIDTILEAAEMKKRGELRRLYVAGCLSERYREHLRSAIPDVDRYFGVTDFRSIIEELGGRYREELLGERTLTTPRHSAFLKISEGCDNPCSFCAIPLMRGGHVSKPLEEIAREAEYLASLGVREINVIGQDTTFYGIDRYGERRLADALRAIAAAEGIEWIRLLYAYPARFPLGTLEVIRDAPNLCRYLDMPIQHIADPVLKSMRRGITSRATRELIARIRESVPGIALRTTLIVGYPAERDADFAELYSFVEETEFDRLGVFSYSVEEGTGAGGLGDPVPAEVKKERLEAIMELQSGISLRKNLARVGSVLPVLLERIEGEFAVGRTEFDAPEIDNEVLVRIAGTPPAPGTFAPVRIVDAEEYDLIAQFEETPV